MSNNYKVGYGKPPKHGQFKQGQSGNPKGRPKGRRNLQTIMNDLVNRTVSITENGRTRRVKYLEAFAHQLAAKALNGSTRDQIMLLKAIRDYAPELLKEAEIPQSLTVRFVEAKDGRPYPSDESESSGEKGKASGEESADPDDLSFLD